jgi:hypothetical protein
MKHCQLKKSLDPSVQAMMFECRSTEKVLRANILEYRSTKSALICREALSRERERHTKGDKYT